MSTDTPRTIDRSDAVNLASNIISRRDTGSYAHGVTDKGMKMLCDAVLTMDRELAAEQEKCKRLREALEKILPKVAHEYQCGTVRPAMHWAEHGSMSFDNCHCEIKSARATMEATQ